MKRTTRNGLTKREIAQLHAAAELVATGQEDFSCHAISITTGYRIWETSSLRMAYSKFYNKSDADSWMTAATPYKTKQEYRLFLLAWFAHVGPSGLRPEPAEVARRKGSEV